MIKKIVLMGVGLLAAVVAATVVVPLFLNPDGFKDPIIRQLQTATGYNLAIGGDISIRLLPFARLRVEDVAITSPLAADGKPFAKAHALDVGVKLWPLISGDIEITRVALENPELTLVKSGRYSNWQAKKMPTARSLETSLGKDKEEMPAPSLAPRSVLLQDIEIGDGTLSYKDTQSGRQLNLSALNLEAGMGTLSSAFTLTAKAAWNGKPVKMNMKLESLATLLNNNLTPLAMGFDSEALTFRADGRADTHRYTGNIAVKSGSLVQALGWLSGNAPATGGVAVALELKALAECSLVQCGVRDAAIRLNNSDITGSAQVNLQSAKPNFSADLTTDTLDITPYLVKKTARVSLVSDAFADVSRWSSKPIDLSALFSVNGNISLRTKRFIANRFSMENALLRAKIDRGTLAADVVNATLYQGQANVSVNMNDNGRTDGRVFVSNVEMEPLLRALSGNDRFSGKGSAQFSFASQGKSEQALVSNLSGGGDIRLVDGSVKGIDLAGMVRNVKSAFVDVDKTQQKTDFAELGGTFTIAKGIVTNNDLTMKAPLFRVAGKGTVDLPNYSLNYLLTPQLVDTLKGQGGKDKEGLGVPIRITGPLDHPSYAPDVEALARGALKDPQKIKDSVKNAKEFLKDKNSIKDIKNLLKGF